MTLLLAFILATGAPGSATGPVTPVEIPDVNVTSGSLNTICSTPTTGCPANSFVKIKLAGRNSVSAQIVPTTFTGTLSSYCSTDGGVNWNAASLYHATSPTRISTPATGTALAAATAITSFSIILPQGGCTDVMTAISAAPTNSLVIRLTASATSDNLSAWGSAKGTQHPSGVGFTTQDLKDSGRSYVALSADGVTPAIAETVITFTKTVADTQTAAQTSYTITNAKILRVQAICASMTAGAAANRIRVALRMNTGGACVAGSNILIPVAELAPNFGTATAAEGGAYVCQSIPDGLEITGNGTKAVCLTENATAASGTLSVNLVAYEY